MAGVALGRSGHRYPMPAIPPERHAGGPSQPPPSGGVRRLVLEHARQPVARSRDFLLRALADWGRLPAAEADGDPTAQDALLLVSELVSNACRHAGGPQQLVLWYDQECLRIEVYDPSTRQPTPRLPHTPSLPGGHGLFVVQRLARSWGVTTYPSAKAVWAELPLGPGR
jgi:hypothetical protein